MRSAGPARSSSRRCPTAGRTCCPASRACSKPASLSKRPAAGLRGSESRGIPRAASSRGSLRPCPGASRVLLPPWVALLRDRDALLGSLLAERLAQGLVEGPVGRLRLVLLLRADVGFALLRQLRDALFQLLTLRQQ